MRTTQSEPQGAVAHIGTHAPRPSRGLGASALRTALGLAQDERRRGRWKSCRGGVSMAGRRENEMEPPSSENADLGWTDVMAAVIRMADTLERLVVILEDLSSVVELPEAAELHRDVQDVRDRKREER